MERALPALPSLPASFAARTTATQAGTSGNSSVMEPAASNHTNRVFAEIFSAKSLGFKGSKKVV